MKNTKKTALIITNSILGAAAITFIIISMVTGAITPYLPMGLACTFIGNALFFLYQKSKKEE
ncbi:MAG: hypothetical protein J5883_06365 [Clostridiales bacterium]|nr:hypothetical protein [Clostridiales bacterium]